MMITRLLQVHNDDHSIAPSTQWWSLDCSKYTMMITWLLQVHNDDHSIAPGTQWWSLDCSKYTTSISPWSLVLCSRYTMMITRLLQIYIVMNTSYWLIKVRIMIIWWLQVCIMMYTYTSMFEIRSELIPSFNIYAHRIAGTFAVGTYPNLPEILHMNIGGTSYDDEPTLMQRWGLSVPSEWGYTVSEWVGVRSRVSGQWRLGNLSFEDLDSRLKLVLSEDSMSFRLKTCDFWIPEININKKIDS